MTEADTPPGAPSCRQIASMSSSTGIGRRPCLSGSPQPHEFRCSQVKSAGFAGAGRRRRRAARRRLMAPSSPA
jgi:hypothetical protein